MTISGNDADLAKLGIVIDASQVTSAATKLDSLTTAGKVAETQTKRLTTATGELAAAQKIASGITADMLKATGLMNGTLEGRLAATKAVEAAQRASATTATELAAIQVGAAKEVAAAEAESAAIVVAAHGAVQGSALEVRESLVILRELSRGNFTRMAGSVSILAGAFGLLTASIIGTLAVVGAVVAPFVAIAIATEKGAAEMAKLNNYLQLTGNAAGVSTSSYDALSRSIAQFSNVSIATAKSALNVLIDSGKISGDTLKDLATLSVLLSQKTGETAAETAKDFLGMTDNVTKFAKEFADKYGALISPAQLKYIAELERQGEKELAEQELIKDAFENIAKLHEEKLGVMARGWDSVTQAVSNYWEHMKDMKKEPTLRQQAAELTQTIELLERAKTAYGPNANLLPAFKTTQSQLDLAKAQLEVTNYQIIAQDKLAAAQSKAATLAEKARQGVIDQLALDKKNADEATRLAEAQGKALENLNKEAKKYADREDANFMLSKNGQSVSDNNPTILEENRLKDEAEKYRGTSSYNKIVDQNDLKLVLFGIEETTKATAGFNKELNETIKLSREAANRLGQNPILNINSGASQGTGDAKQPKFDIDAFKLKEAEAYLQILERVNKETQQAATDMANAFGHVGKAVGGLSAVMAEYNVAMQANETKRKAAIQNNTEASVANAAASAENTASELKYNGDLLASAKSLFNEKSIIYKTLTVAEDVYRALQLASAIEQMVSNTATTVSTEVSAASQASSWGVVAVARALAAYAPPFGFIAAAAVVAALAAIGVSITGGGSGANSGPIDAESRQSHSGAGSVLGESTTKTNSILNALADASKNSNIMLEYTNSMVQSLRSIENNIGSLTNAIARNIGIYSGGAFDTSGLNLGNKHSNTNNLGAISFLTGGMPTFFTTNTARSLQDFGIAFKPQTLESTANSILGNIYQQVLTSSSSNLLGIKLSSSKSTSVVDNAITADISTQVQKVIASLKTGVLAAAGALGITGASATLNAFVVSLGTISFNGLKTSEIQDELNAVFGKLGDNLATALVPALRDLQKAGEGAFETLVRLATEYQTVDVTLASIGQKFSAVGLSSIKARDNLVQLAGGLDAFTSKAQFLSQNFMTGAQQVVPTLAAVKQAMASLGESGITTRQQFLALVQSLDVSTDAGQSLYTQLLNIAPAFNQVAQSVLDYTKASIGILNTLSSLRAAQNGTTTQNNLQIARGDFNTTLALAKTGDLNALNTLPGLAQTFASTSQTGSPNALAYSRDLSIIRAGLNSALAVSQAVANSGDIQSAILQATTDGLTETQTTQGILRQQTAYLAAITTAAQGQLTAFTTINSTPAGQALQAAATAAADAAAAATSKADVHKMTGVEAAASLGPLDGLFKGHNTPLMDIQSALIKGIPISDASYTKAGIPRLPGFAGGGSFMVGGSGGTDSQYVRFWASPNERVTVTTPAQTNESTNLIQEVKNLRIEIANVSRYSKKTADLLLRVSQDGQSFLTKAA